MYRSFIWLAMAGGALAILAKPAFAEPFIAGSKLAHACAGHAPAEQNACDGYIAGVLDQMSTEPAAKGAACLPPTIKLVTLRETLAKYSGDHSADSGAALVRDMLKAAYPCASK